MKYKLLIVLILLFSIFIRFYKLGVNPPSLDWDETSLGYNAYSILKTGRDEYGTFLPFAIRSFNDYKPPLYTYLTIIPVAMFGLNEYSTRFISALMGSFAVLVGYFLVKSLFPGSRKRFYLLFLLLFAVSPWHIQFSRVAFEANTALTFFLLGFWLFLDGRQNGRMLLISSLSFALSMYAYHSSRLVIPVILLGLIFLYRKELVKQIKWCAVSIMLLGLLTLPILIQMSSSTGARFGSVTVLNPAERLGPSIESIEYDQKNGDILGKLMHNRRIVFGREIIAGYLDHFNFDFLFLTGDSPGRHHAAGMGMLYLWELPFILIGLFYVLINRNRGNYVIILWFLTAPLASSLTTGTPHAVRALLYIPTFQIFAAFGVIEFINWLKNSYSGKLSKYTMSGITGLLFVLFIFNIYYYFNSYWIQTPYEYSRDWQYGYKEMVGEVAKIENNFGKVTVTYRYDQPYIFFLFYNKVDPIWYQNNWGAGEIQRSQRNFGKYEFRNIDWSKDKGKSNTIIVGTGEEIPPDTKNLEKEIKFLDGSIAFRIVANL